MEKIKVGDFIYIPKTGFTLEVTQDKTEVGKYTTIYAALAAIESGEAQKIN